MEDLEYLIDYFDQKIRELDILVTRRNSYKYHFVSDEVLSEYKMHQISLKVLVRLQYKTYLHDSFIMTANEARLLGEWFKIKQNEFSTKARNNSFDSYYLYKFIKLLNKEIFNNENS